MIIFPLSTFRHSSVTVKEKTTTSYKGLIVTLKNYTEVVFFVNLFVFVLFFHLKFLPPASLPDGSTQGTASIGQDLT